MGGLVGDRRGRPGVVADRLVDDRRVQTTGITPVLRGGGRGGIFAYICIRDGVFRPGWHGWLKGGLNGFHVQRLLFVTRSSETTSHNGRGGRTIRQFQSNPVLPGRRPFTSARLMAWKP